MLKIILCFCMLVSSVATNEVTSIESIEYLNDYSDGYLNVEIVILTGKRDIVELSAFLKNDESVVKEYTSIIEINQRSKSIAKIPVDEECNKIQFKFKSLLKNTDIEDIETNIYKNSKEVCYLNKEDCISKYPSLITYKNGKITETYERIQLINAATLESKNNYLPVDKIKLFANLYNIKGYAELYIYNKTNSLALDYNNGYTIPLELTWHNNYLTFRFLNNYYLDKESVITFENYKNGTIYSNDILLSEGIYKLYISIYDGFASFYRTNLVLNLIVSTSKNNCIISFKRVYS